MLNKELDCKDENLVIIVGKHLHFILIVLVVLVEHFLKNLIIIIKVIIFVDKNFVTNLANLNQLNFELLTNSLVINH